MEPGRVTLDTVDGLIAVETHALDGSCAYSVLVTPEQWVSLVEKAEDYPAVKQLRREQSVAAARELLGGAA